MRISGWSADVCSSDLARESVVAEVERGFTGDLIVQAEGGGFGGPGGFPPSVADTIAAIEGVETVSRVGFTQAQVTSPDGQTATQFVQSVDRSERRRLWNEWVSTCRVRGAPDA